MHRGFRFDLHPTPAQAETLGQWVGATRLVYNLALEQRRDFWRQYRGAEGRHLSWVSQSREVTQLRREYDFLRAVPRECLEQALRDLDKAFQAFFAARAGYPGFRRLGTHDALRFQGRYSSARQLNARWGEVRIPGIGWVKFRSSRPIAGELRNVTVRREAGRWHVAFACDVSVEVVPNDLPSVGIDRGIANAISLSTGEFLSPPDWSGISARAIKAQRILARRRRGSRRHARQKLRMRKLLARVARTRSDWNHKASTGVSRRFGVVALEDLNIQGMTASARGTVDNPGRMVRQKAGLNRAILNKGWGQFAVMLEYKLEAAGGRLVYVPAAYTSQTCSGCGVVDRQSRKSQATFACVHCGHVAHADTNAAIEIRRRSTALLLAEGGQLGRPVEPRTLAA